MAQSRTIRTSQQNYPPRPWRAAVWHVCAVLTTVLTWACGERDRPAPGSQAVAPRVGMGSLSSALPPTSDSARFRPRRGEQPAPELARRPRFRPPKEGAEAGFRCLPDGDLTEWAKRSWTQIPPIDATQKGSHHADLSARFALGSYGSGVSLAIDVTDDVHKPAATIAALATADAVELSVWPQSSAAPPGKAAHPALGVHLRLGTLRRLVAVEGSGQRWRADTISGNGVARAGGYHLELRLPLKVLTPLGAPVVDRLRLEITVRDRDEQGSAQPKARWKGTLDLDPPLQVPEAVQRRISVRVCMAAQPDALWGYHNGWRCSLAAPRVGWSTDDRHKRPAWRLKHARMPEPPRLTYLRERVVLLNFPGLRRGVAALVDRRETILSLLPLGVVGEHQPGSALARESDARALRLPDGTWAVAVTHAHPASEDALDRGGRCNPGHLVLGSVIAVRGAPHVTPHQHVPDPKTPPRLEEVFRIVLDDCDAARSFDWHIAKDARRVTVRDRLSPLRPPALFIYHRGWFRRRGQS